MPAAVAVRCSLARAAVSTAGLAALQIKGLSCLVPHPKAGAAHASCRLHSAQHHTCTCFNISWIPQGRLVQDERETPSGEAGQAPWPVQLCLSNGHMHSADLVISAIGVQPNTAWLPQSLPRDSSDGGILVDRCAFITQLLLACDTAFMAPAAAPRLKQDSCGPPEVPAMFLACRLMLK